MERPTRPRSDFKPEEFEPENGLAVQIAANIRSRIQAGLATDRSVRFSEILKGLADAPWNELHVATGVAMQIVLTDHEIATIREYRWTRIRAAAEIQDIEITNERAR